MLPKDELVAKGPQFHLWLYGEHYRAYLINKSGGYTEQAKTNRRAMREILSLGTLRDEGWKAKLLGFQRRTRFQLAVTTAFLNGVMLGEEVRRKQSV